MRHFPNTTTVPDASPSRFTAIILALMLLFSTGMQARNSSTHDDEVLALQISLALTIQKYSSAADTIAKELASRFSRNPEMLTAIARAYFQNRDKSNTILYLKKAIRADRTYAKAYVTYGNIFNGDEAAGAFCLSVDSATYYYTKAIVADSKNEDAYLGLATAQSFLNDSLMSAKATLEKLHKINRDYNVDLTLADLSSKRGASEMSYAFLDNCDPYTLDESHLADYIVKAYIKKKYDRSLEVSKIGMLRFPDNKGFNRLCAWNLVPLGEYAEALKYGQQWIDATPKDSLNSIDMYVMGTANIALGNIDKGFEFYSRIPDMKDQFATQLTPFIKVSIEKICDNFVSEKKYDLAASLYKKSMETYPQQDESYRLYYLSNIYTKQLIDTEDMEKKKAYLNKMFSLYNEIETKYPDWYDMPLIYLQEARFTENILDPDEEKCLAEPYYRKLFNSLVKQGNFTETKKVWVAEACKYLGTIEYRNRNNGKKAIAWWQTGLKYTPDDKDLKKWIEIVSKKRK